MKGDLSLLLLLFLLLLIARATDIDAFWFCFWFWFDIGASIFSSSVLILVTVAVVAVVALGCEGACLCVPLVDRFEVFEYFSKSGVDAAFLLRRLRISYLVREFIYLSFPSCT